MPAESGAALTAELGDFQGKRSRWEGGSGTVASAAGAGVLEEATGLSPEEGEEEASSAAHERAVAAYEKELKARYYEGALPLEELVNYRRKVASQTFDAWCELLHGRGVALEAVLYRAITEELPLRSADSLGKHSWRAAQAAAWCDHWSCVAAVNAAAAEELPELSDPLLALAKERLRLRRQLLEQRLTCERAIAERSAEAVDLGWELKAWCERMGPSLLRRAEADRATV
jgi:hypothetical protein